MVVGLRQVKVVVAGSYLFTAVKVLFKWIKYFQPKHLSMGSIIILTEHITFSHQPPSDQ